MTEKPSVDFHIVAQDDWKTNGSNTKWVKATLGLEAGRNSNG